MNRHEEILHQMIAEGWNNSHLNNHPESQRLICQWNNAPNKQYGNKMRSMGVKPGVSDWQYICDNGLSIWIELKIEGGIQSPDQIKFEALCKYLGHRYEIARSYAEFWEICGIECPFPESKLMTKSPYQKIIT